MSDIQKIRNDNLVGITVEKASGIQNSLTHEY